MTIEGKQGGGRSTSGGTSESAAYVAAVETLSDAIGDCAHLSRDPKRLREAFGLPRLMPDFLISRLCSDDEDAALYMALLVEAFRALETGDRQALSMGLDNVSVSLFVGFLYEEEGLAWAIENGQLAPADVGDHVGAHVNLMKWWYRELFTPAKDDGLADSAVAGKLAAFGHTLVDHLDRYNRVVCPGWVVEMRALKSEHVARTGLPVSPFDPGAMDVARTLGPFMFERLNRDSFGERAGEPLKAESLASASVRLWSAGKGAFRDVFAKAVVAEA